MNAIKKIVMGFVVVCAAVTARAEGKLVYELLDYIGTDKAKDQYIDTGYVPNANTTTTAEFQAKDADGGYVFGTYNGNSGRCQFLYKNNSPFIGFGADSVSGSGLTADQEWHTVGLTNGTFRLDGRDYWSNASYSWSGTALSLHLFACNRSGAHQTSDKCGLRLRSLVISEGGVVKHDFVPARSAISGEVGLLDRTTSRFISKTGSGELEAGDVVGRIYAVVRELNELTESALATALSEANNGDEIVLPAGTLTLTKRCEINKGVTVRGSGNRETVVTMEQGKSDGAFLINDKSAILENLTIDGVCIAGNATLWSYKGAGVELNCGTLRNVTVRNCSPSANNVSAVLFPTCTDASHPCLMENCTITNNDCGTSKDAIGTVLCQNAGAIIRNCEIAWNKGEGSAGLYLEYGMAEYCDIHHNEARESAGSGSGGGVRIDNSAVVSCCAITNNTAAGDGGGVWLRGGSMVNCLVAKNAATGNGGGICVEGQGGSACYCNIGGNTAQGSGAGVYVNTDSATASPTLRYNLIALNGDDRAKEISIAKGKPTFANSAMSKETFEVIGGDWCRELTKDPFRADGSYLTVDSPDYEGIDDAEESPTGGTLSPKVDILGRTRPILGFRIADGVARAMASDIGCCEYDSHYDGKLYVSATGSGVSPYATPETAATNLDDALQFVTTWKPSAATLAVEPGTYDTKGAAVIPANVLLCGDGALGEVVLTSSRTIDADKAVLVVNGGTVSNLVVTGGVSAGSNDGTVPAASGVWVKKGLITGCEISGCKVLKGNFEANGSCAQALVLGVTAATTEKAIAYGCKISDNDGCFGTTSGVGNYPRGSALYVANGGRIERCEVADNRGSPGGVTMINNAALSFEMLVDGCDIHDNYSYNLPGGILLGTNSRVWNTRIASNRVERNVNSFGGGVRGLAMSCELVNCLIEGNEADVGGGLYTACNANRIVHCTIVGNKAGTAGGLCLETGSNSGLIQNTIVAGNVSESGDQIVRDGGFFDVKNSLLANRPEGLVDRGGNLVGVSPKFVNPAAHNWRLRKKSPCVDAGSSDYPTPYYSTKNYGVDFDGTERPQDGNNDGSAAPDMGCYEYVYRNSGLLILVK